MALPMSESARDDLEKLDSEFAEMMQACYGEQMIGAEQYSDMRLAFFGGVRVSATLLAGNWTKEMLHEACNLFIANYKRDEEIA